MQMKRFFAMCLCVMMVVCALPVMQVSAETYDTISQVMGTNMGYKMGYQFNADFTPGSDVLHANHEDFPGRVSYTADGMSFPLGEATYWYNKPAENPYLYGSATVVKAKFGSTSESMNIQINNKVDTGRTYVEVYPTYIKSYPSNATASCSIGTDWFELMTVMTDANGYAVYLKNESTGNRWSLLLKESGYRSGSTYGYMSLVSTASTSVLVKSVEVYHEKSYVFEDVDGIFGKDMEAGVDYTFSSDFVPGAEFKHYEGDTHPGRVSFTENGVVYPGGKPTIWYLTPQSGAVATGTGVAIKAKLTDPSASLNFEVNNPNSSSGRAFVICNSTSMTAFGSKDVNGTTTNTSIGYNVALGTDWFEVMIVITEAGYDVYVKNAATNNAWTRAFEMTSYRTSRTFGGVCVSSSSSTDVYLKNLQIYREKQFVFDSVDAIFGKEMSSKIKYQFNENFVAGSEFKHYEGDTHPGRVSFTENGATYPASQPTIWYLQTGAKPVTLGTGVALEMKFASASDSFNLEINNPSGSGRAYVTYTGSSIKAYGTKSVDGVETAYNETASISLGTDWFETMLVPKDDGYRVFVKNAATENNWKLVLDMVGYRSSSAFGDVSMAVGSITGAYIKTLQIYQDKPVEITDELIAAQKQEIAQGMEAAKNTTVTYKEIPAYNPTIEKYSHIKAITYDGVNYRGKKTKTFAYLGFPEGASAESKVPAVVLIHGGGGHPYLEWVRLWNERGYAAIAMETTGHFPKVVNAGIDESHSSDYAYDFGDFAEDGYILSPKCGNPTLYTETQNHWNYQALTKIIMAGNILRQDERVDSSKMGVTGVSWGGTLTTQLIGIDNRFAFAIPIYGTAYLSDPMCTFENYGNDYVKRLWGAEQNLSNATMPIMWYVWNSDHAFGIPQYVKSYNQTAPLNEKNVLFIRDNWGHSHGQVFNESRTENHSKIFADWVLNGNGGYPNFTQQPAGRNFQAKFRVPEGVTGDITATIYYLENPMVYTKSGGSHSLGQTWKKTTEGITVDKANGIVKGSVPAAAAGYYINLEFTVNGVACETSTVYTEVDNLEVANLGAETGYSFRIDCQAVAGYTGKVLAALYNGKRLEEVRILDPMATQTINFGETECDTLKVFWWDGFTNLNNKGRVVELSL